MDNALEISSARISLRIFRQQEPQSVPNIIFGRKTLDPKEVWADITDVEALDAAGWQFFKAEVEMK